MKLRDALHSLSTGQLHRIAASWGVRIESGSLRAELIDLVAAAIEAGLRGGQIGQLPGDTGHQALVLLAQAGGRQEVGLLRRRLAARMAGGTPDDVARAIDRALSGLVDRGLAFRMFEVDGQRRGTFLVAPDDVVAALRDAVRPLRPGVGRVPPPARIAECDPTRDLFVLASALRREAWSATGAALAGRAPRTATQVVARLGAVFADAGPGRPSDRWRMHLAAGRRSGWLAATDSAEPDPLRIDELLNDPVALSNALWTTTAEGAFGRTTPTGGSRQTAARLHADAVQVLASAAVDEWWSSDDLIGAVLEEAAATVTTTGEADAPVDTTIRVETPSVASGRDRSLLRGWLEGRWFWLGLVRWGQEDTPLPSGGSHAWARIAVTARLRQLGPGTAVGMQAASCLCRLGPEPLTLVAPLTCDLAALYRAEPYLAYAGGGETRRYRLTPASFERGLRLGGDADSLLGLIATLLGEPAPAEWQDALHAWAAPTRPRLSLESRLVLSAATEEDLDAAIAAAPPDAAPERISNRLAVVAPAQVAELLTALDEAGVAVDLSVGLRAEGTRPGVAAAVDRGVAETTWLALALLERLGGRAFAGEPRFGETRSTLAAILPVEVRAALERRATTLVARAASGRGSRRRRGGGVV